MSFIKQCVKKIKKKLRDRNAIKKTVKKCSQYMLPGWWHVECQYDKYVLMKGAFPKDCTGKGLIRTLFFGVYRVNNYNPKAQCGKALSSSFENYKLFDESNGKVYTMYSDIYWNKIASFCSGMRPYFHTEILLEDKENHVLVECFLQDEQAVDIEKCFHYFCEEYKNYLQHVSIGEKTITAAYVKEILDSAKLPEDVRGYLNHIEKNILDYDVQYPVILCHNDVHINNIMTRDNENFVLIDYELCGENVFFFDFMGLIFTSAVFMNAPSLYHVYLRCELDEQLAELFDICGMQYDACDKKRYLFAFLLFRIYMIYRDCPDRLSEYTGRMWRFFRQNGLM